MKQHEAVIRAMEENGGYATLGFLYQNALKLQGSRWGTKTPFASIRRIVQDQRYFFKIRPGLWALKSYGDRLPPHVWPRKGREKGNELAYNHTYYQGLLVELGNLKMLATFVPKQDRNKPFLGRTLGEMATLRDIFRFSYEHIVRLVECVDVSWFNEREMPAALFEVEHTTTMQNSMVKFVELQDFGASFHIVADGARRREFLSKLSLQAFKPVSQRVRFLSYEDVSELHAKGSEYISAQSRIGL